MSTLLIRNISLLVTMDTQRREISNGAIFIRDGLIEKHNAAARRLLS